MYIYINIITIYLLYDWFGYVCDKGDYGSLLTAHIFHTDQMCYTHLCVVYMLRIFVCVHARSNLFYPRSVMLLILIRFGYNLDLVFTETSMHLANQKIMNNPPERNECIWDSSNTND